MGGVIKIITFRVEWKGISKRTLNEEDENNWKHNKDEPGCDSVSLANETNHNRPMSLSHIQVFKVAVGSDIGIGLLLGVGKCQK